MSEDVLRVVDVYAGYVSGLPIVNGISLRLRSGEILSVFGPNGAGKSTMVRAIAGVVRIAAGRVQCSGRELAGLPSWQIARAGVAYVPQRANVFAEMTVTENLALGWHSRSGAAPGVTFDEVLRLFSGSGAVRRDACWSAVGWAAPDGGDCTGVAQRPARADAR